VTILGEEGWAAALADLDPSLAAGAAPHPSIRRANLLIAGLELANTRGRILRIGPCRLRVWTECTPCRQMDEALPGLRQALRPGWRGGVCAEVVEGGAIALDDPVSWEE
jgi:MOSC domain-containing protein YiiM